QQITGDDQAAYPRTGGQGLESRPGVVEPEVGEGFPVPATHLGVAQVQVGEHGRGRGLVHGGAFGRQKPIAREPHGWTWVLPISRHKATGRANAGSPPREFPPLPPYRGPPGSSSRRKATPGRGSAGAPSAGGAGRGTPGRRRRR